MRQTHRTLTNVPILTLPNDFTFKAKGVIDFNNVLSIFDWSAKSKHIIIDARFCQSIEYQTLTLLILYIWQLKRKKIHINLQYSKHSLFGKMWQRMNGTSCFKILNNTQDNFHYVYNKPIFAIKYKDYNITQMLNTIRDYAMDLPTDLIRGYEDAVRYIISELTYNALEHGFNPQIPSLLQFNWYRDKNQLSFILADLGVGIKTHLEQTYAPFTNNTDAIAMALEPEISGTFGVNVGPYKQQNNAGMGLYLSSNLGKTLEADMYIVSGDGVAHISPLDVTYTTLNNSWPGTFIYMTIGFDRLKTYDLHKHLEDFRKHATETVAKRNNIVRAPELYIDMYNYCGERCEVKLEAINLRERKIIPAIQKGETVILDFSHAITATHSFLTALLADPIKILGLKSYKQIKIIGANETIRTIIDFVFDTYTN